MPGSVVNTFMEQLNHPFKSDIERLRARIIGITPEISEEIKWNAPSFKIKDHFATFKLHPANNIQIVLHTGAKPKIPQNTFVLDDPHKLLKWPAIDRCVITLQSSRQAMELEDVVIGMVQEWIRQLRN